MRLLFWLMLLLIAVAWLSRKIKKPAGLQKVGGKPAGEAEKMLQCRHCGLHIPASEALLHNSGTVFCSEEHKRLIFP